MLRGTTSKVMWVGRATVFLVGLAVILALVFGVASTVLGANGGNFILGKNNAATALTKLTANANGAAVRVQNTNAGTNDTALDARVQPGEAPLRVNSDTKVANLNADKLDGKSEADFYAAGSKVADSSQADQADSATSAADADKLDGKDSTEFLSANQKAADSELLDGIDSSGFSKAYKRTVVVGPVGTDTENGQALLDAMDNITDASASKPYLLHIEPATYNLGTGLNTGSLNMKPFVDIEGSGELNTVITSGIQTNCQFTRPGTVNGASNAEMRFLTVRNTERICSTAISNVSASPRLTHVTAEHTGDNQIISAVWNYDSAPTMTDVTATVSRGFSVSVAVHNVNSSPTIRQSKLSGSTAALIQQTQGGDGTAKVALTQLVGPVQVFSGSVQCFNNYNQNLAAVSCP